MIRRRVVVRGEVQGVFFRDGLRQEAERRGVAGWVRNAADGSVEAELEDSPENVSALVDWCREGPAQADVQDVDVAEVDARGGDGFEVR